MDAYRSFKLHRCLTHHSYVRKKKRLSVTRKCDIGWSSANAASVTIRKRVIVIGACDLWSRLLYSTRGIYLHDLSPLHGQAGLTSCLRPVSYTHLTLPTI